jgi:hypothetical protein
VAIAPSAKNFGSHAIIGNSSSTILKRCNETRSNQTLLLWKLPSSRKLKTELMNKRCSERSIQGKFLNFKEKRRQDCQKQEQCWNDQQSNLWDYEQLRGEDSVDAWRS